MTIIDILLDAGTQMAIAPVIIAAGISALSSLIGQGVSARNNRKAREEQQASLDKLSAQQQAALETMRQDEQNWYDREYNVDAMQRADAQRAINMVSEQIRQRNRDLAGKAAMGGLTDEAVALQKAAGNNEEAKIISGIVADAAARKDKVADTHAKNLQSLNQAQLNANQSGTMAQMELNQANAQARAQSLATAMQTAGNLAAGIASAQDFSGVGSQEPVSSHYDAVGQMPEQSALNPKPVETPKGPTYIKTPTVLDSKTQLNR